MSDEFDWDAERQDLLARIQRDDPDAGVDLVKMVLGGWATPELIAAALDSGNPRMRAQGLVAMGDYSRLNGTMEYAVVVKAKALLRDTASAGSVTVSGYADDAIDDTVYHDSRRSRFITLFPRRWLRFERRKAIRRLKEFFSPSDSA
ncbi:hypothetical protein [Actinoplanes sp. HUAS TT8]|uniref:hypothetical protein n=1 Tax=Actinoplanes sp. HUAS TT8 TaxID=3447453 RepID=UPI003F5281B4